MACADCAKTNIPVHTHASRIGELLKTSGNLTALLCRTPTSTRRSSLPRRSLSLLQKEATSLKHLFQVMDSK